MSHESESILRPNIFAVPGGGAQNTEQLQRIPLIAIFQWNGGEGVVLQQLWMRFQRVKQMDQTSARQALQAIGERSIVQ